MTQKLVLLKKALQSYAVLLDPACFNVYSAVGVWRQLGSYWDGVQVHIILTDNKSLHSQAILRDNARVYFVHAVAVVFPLVIS